MGFELQRLLEGMGIISKNEKHMAAYTLRYYKESIGVFFLFDMHFTRRKINPTASMKVCIYYKQPERMDCFSQQEIDILVKRLLQELKKIKRSDFYSDYSYRRKIYKIKLQYLMLKIMFSTGIRPWETVHIELDDFQPEKLRLRIRTKGNQQ